MTWDEVVADGERTISLAIVALTILLSVGAVLFHYEPNTYTPVYKKPRVCGPVWNTPEDPTHGVLKCWVPTPQEDDGKTG